MDSMTLSRVPTPGLRWDISKVASIRELRSTGLQILSKRMVKWLQNLKKRGVVQ